MKLDKFDGGLRLKPAPHFINANEAREYVNINTDRGTLSPEKDKLEVPIQNPLLYGAFYVEENRFVFKPNPTDFVEFQRILYYTDRINTPKKIIDGTEYNLGIEAPANVDVDLIPGNLSGTFTWAITYYNVTDGSESPPILTDEIVLEDQAAQFTVPKSHDTQVTRVRIYRVGSNFTVFSLVVEFDINTSSEYTITDNTSSSVAAAIPLSTDTGGTPVADLKYLIEANAMLFGASGSKLYYTPINQPWNWPPLNFIAFPRPITAIGNTANGLIVATRFETFLITGSTPTSLSRQLISNSQGAISNDSVQNIQDACVWASGEGLCVSNGGKVNVITRSRLDLVRFDIDSSAVNDQKYFGHLTDGRTLVVDFETGVLSYLEASIGSILKANEILYGFSNGKLFELFAGSTNLPWRWQSARFIGPGYTQPKMYKIIFIYSEGPVNFKVFINDDVAADVNLQTGLNEIRVQIKNTRGYYMHFYAEGTGEIFEITWREANPDG